LNVIIEFCIPMVGPTSKAKICGPAVCKTICEINFAQIEIEDSVFSAVVVVAVHASDHFLAIPLYGPSTIPSCPTRPTASTYLHTSLIYRLALELPETVLLAVVVDGIQG